MGITGSATGITGSAIENLGSGNLVILAIFVLVIIGVAVFEIRRRMRKKRR